MNRVLVNPKITNRKAWIIFIPAILFSLCLSAQITVADGTVVYGAQFTASSKPASDVPVRNWGGCYGNNNFVPGRLDNGSRVINAGDWLEFSLNVPAANEGTYTVAVYTGGAWGGTHRVNVSLNGTAIATNSNPPQNTCSGWGGSGPTTITGVTLCSNSANTLRVTFVDGDVGLHQIVFTRTSPAGCSTTPPDDNTPSQPPGVPATQCSASYCPNQVVGYVDFSYNGGTPPASWQLNQINKSGAVGAGNQTLTTTYSYNGTANLIQNGSYTIVRNPSSIVGGASGHFNGIQRARQLQNITGLNGIFLARRNGNTPITYRIQGLNSTQNAAAGSDRLRYCLEIVLRSVGLPHEEVVNHWGNPCNNYGNNYTVTVRNRGTNTNAALSNSTYSFTNNGYCSPNSGSGTWTNGNHINNGLLRYGDRVVLNTTVTLGAEDGFDVSILLPGPDDARGYVYGIESIKVSGCTPVIPEEITSSQGDNMAAGTTTTLTAIGICPANATNYEWRIGNASGTVLPSTANTINVTVNQTTTYWVSCGGKTLTKTITVPQSLTSSAGNSFCEGTVTTLQASGLGSASDTYIWTQTRSGVTTTLTATGREIELTPHIGTTTYSVRNAANETLSITIEATNCCAINNSLYSITKICHSIAPSQLIHTPVWNIIPWQQIDGTQSQTLGDTGANGGDAASAELRTVEFDKLAQWRAAYDGESLYFFIRTFDPNPRAAYMGMSDRPWSQDGVEIFLELNNPLPSRPLLQFAYAWNGNNSVLKYPLPNTTISDVQVLKSEQYWDLFVRIPVAENDIRITSDGRIRMELGINQAKDNSERRTAQLFTWQVANHFQTTTHFTELSMNDCMTTRSSVSEVCSGESITLSVPVSSISGLYEWQQKTASDDAWQTVATGSENTATVIPTINGTRQYRALIDGVAFCPVTVASPQDCMNTPVCSGGNVFTAPRACTPPIGITLRREE